MLARLGGLGGRGVLGACEKGERERGRRDGGVVFHSIIFLEEGMISQIKKRKV